MSKVTTYLCPGCDQLLKTVPSERGYLTRCPRCYHQVQGGGGSPNVMAHCRALTLAALILSFPAYACSILMLDIAGTQSANTVASGVWALWQQQLYMVSLLVFVFAVLVPLTRLSLLLLIVLPSYSGAVIVWRVRFMRFHHILHGWGMLDIFLLSVLVAIIKLEDMAEISFGMGMYCLAVMMLLEIKASQLLPRQKLWQSTGKAGQLYDGQLHE